MDARLGLMWGLKGKQPEIITSSPFGRVNLIGFVDPVGGRVIINQINKGNGDCFIEQLNIIKNKKRRYKTIAIYVDNASWHKTKKLDRWLKINKRIKIEYLPKYAPDINPMERHWWYLRKKKTKNKVYESKEECWDDICEHTENLNKEEIIRICQI